MLRNVVFGLVPLVMAGCGPASGDIGEREAIPAAFAAARPWRFETAPADTFPAVARRVWSGYQADFLVGPSPDGRRVALTDWMTGDMVVLDLATTDTVRLTRNVTPYQPGFGMFPRSSRDGRQVVFGWWDAERPANWQLRVAEVAGNPEPRVIYDGSNTVWIQPEDWSPDGRWILAWRVLEDPVAQIVLVSSAGDSVRVLKTLDWRNPIRMNFSPDGRWILYDFPPDEHTEQRDVYALAVDGSRESRLVQHPADDFVLGWAPDGNVLFMSDRTGTPGAWLLPVADGRSAGPPALVKPDMFQTSPIAFLEDGSYMYGIQTGTRDVFVATLDPRGAIVGAPVKVAARSMGSTLRPAWSPDGRHLAYVIQQGPVPFAPRRLAIRSLESGDVRELALSNRLGYVQTLHWAADGNSVLLQAQDEKGRNSVFRFDVQTGRSEPLLQRSTDIYMRQVELTPDGATLVINEEDRTNEPMIERRIVVRDLRSAEERVLFRMAARFDQQIRHLTLSPDGRQAAFVNWRGGTPGGHEVMVMPLAGGEPRKVATGGMISLRFGPDGSHLFFSEPTDANSLEADSRLMRVSVNGGEPEPVGVTMHDIQDIRVHAPSRRIAFTAGRPQAELWIMENFLPGAGRARVPSSGR